MIANLETMAGQPLTLAQIDGKAAVYAAAREELANELTALRADLDAAKDKHLKRVKMLAARAAQAEAEGRAAVELSPAVFTKPKTFVLHGIKCGYRMANGKIVFDDADLVIKALRRRFKDSPEKLEQLIRVKEEVNKDGLKTLTAAELQAVGCRLEGAGEQIVFSAINDEVEKMVGKLIEEMVEVMLETE